MCILPPCKVIYEKGQIYDFEKQFKLSTYRLIRAFKEVEDGRKKKGTRYEIELILLILFGGITAGYTTIQDCCLWGNAQKEFIHKRIYLVHGIPYDTTVSRALKKLDIDSLITAFRKWIEIMFGSQIDTVASFDGKTMRGISTEEKVRHIVSLFSHNTKQILNQVAVQEKENEIPAAIRLLKGSNLKGMTLIGDALHTQKNTAEEILLHKAHYLLYVKKNQRDLYDDIRLHLEQLKLNQTQTDTATLTQQTSNRDITTTVTISQDPQIIWKLQIKGWPEIATIGKLERTGTRTEKGKKHDVQEIVYFITSNKTFTAADIGKHLRNHWSIENNLHWQKDYNFQEDKQHLRTGNAPQVMTFLRSCCLTIFYLLSVHSIATTLHTLQMNQHLHRTFLTAVGIV